MDLFPSIYGKLFLGDSLVLVHYVYHLFTEKCEPCLLKNQKESILFVRKRGAKWFTKGAVHC
jgi:hypothetical protein